MFSKSWMTPKMTPKFSGLRPKSVKFSWRQNDFCVTSSKKSPTGPTFYTTWCYTAEFRSRTDMGGWGAEHRSSCVRPNLTNSLSSIRDENQRNMYSGHPDVNRTQPRAGEWPQWIPRGRRIGIRHHNQLQPINSETIQRSILWIQIQFRHESGLALDGLFAFSGATPGDLWAQSVHVWNTKDIWMTRNRFLEGLW